MSTMKEDITCPSCQGRGVVEDLIMFEKVCAMCDGSGVYYCAPGAGWVSNEDQARLDYVRRNYNVNW